MDKSNEMVGAVDQASLSEAFTGKKSKKSAGGERGHKGRAPIIVLVVGIVALVVGLAVLLINIFSQAGVRDAEYLVEVGSWQREDEPSVIWQFSEIGEGALTTDSHGNDYDFKWAIEDGVLKIETEWLYVFNEDYDYTLDKANNTLKLTSGEEEWVFVPA